MPEPVINVLFWLTGAVLGNMSPLELIWVASGFAALYRHMRNLVVATADWRGIDAALALKKITEFEAEERRVVVQDRRVTESIRSYKQVVFTGIGLFFSSLAPGPTTEQRVGAAVLGLGLISVQILLLFNSTFNARTRNKLERLAAEKRKRDLEQSATKKT